MPDLSLNYKYNFLKYFLTLSLVLVSNLSFGQKKSTIHGIVKFADTVFAGAKIVLDSSSSAISDNNGVFIFSQVPFGKSVLEVYKDGLRRYRKTLTINSSTIEIQIVIANGSNEELEEVIMKKKLHLNGLGRMEAIRGTAIFEGKKNDVLVMKNIDANMATNNARQVFAKVAGTNVWENDGSGIQLNVSSRGLSPNRSWEYNMRQNEYDIAADILGYPDMYYSPPMDAISHIEVVRGSASLQYGTQMGGLLNFVLKQGSTTKPIEIEMKQSVGSYGLFNSYNSIGGSKGKWNYFGYYHHRTANGWRENSDYNWNTGYAVIGYDVNSRLKIKAEYTRMEFLLHLSAGLTDSLYKIDARKSFRERNYFHVNWNIPSVRVEYKIGNTSSFSITSYMLLSSRSSVENTKPVNNLADTGYRDIRNDHYRNFGTEMRYLNEYKLSADISGILTGGVRYYNGRTLRGQGLGTAGNDANFKFINPNNLEYSDYSFRNRNVAFFVENAFRIGKLSIVPGIRYEFIKFLADGYFNSNTVGRVVENGISSTRRFPLMGVGFEYKVNKDINVYANYTQGYRSANFNDIRITSPNIEIDPNLKDSKGHNVDLGIRGNYKSCFTFDVNAFYLKYNDRIGLVTRTRPDNSTYLISTNIANSRNMGIESFGEVNIIRALQGNKRKNLSLFVSYSYIDARYISSEKDLLTGKKVESAPNHILRGGLTYKVSRFSSTVNYSYISDQFSDANNTAFTATGSNGLVPAYQILDWSSKVTISSFRVGFTLNNLANNKYFTRRATSYPGPGIIPAEPTTFLVSFEVKM